MDLLETLAVKPIRRSDIVLDKWIGYVIIAAAYLDLLFFGVLAVVRLVAGHIAVHPARGLGLMLLEVALLVTVMIAGGTRLGTVANGIFARAVAHLDRLAKVILHGSSGSVKTPRNTCSDWPRPRPAPGSTS